MIYARYGKLSMRSMQHTESHLKHLNQDVLLYKRKPPALVHSLVMALALF